jgi:glycosyltransferase involved in cell wall biosynthesis
MIARLAALLKTSLRQAMKLLSMFPSAVRGGAEEYALTIAAAARRAGWEVHAAFPQRPATASLARAFETKGIAYHPLGIAFAPRKRFDLLRARIPRFLRTLALVKSLTPDAVHLSLPWPTVGFESLLACGLLRVPTAVVLHLFPHAVTFRPIRLKAYAWARSRNQRWVAISEYNRRLISESFKIPPNQVTLIYNGTAINSQRINLTPFADTELRALVRRELSLPETSTIVLTVARLHPTKGYQELAQAAVSLVREFSDVTFVWVGEGDLRDYLVAKVKEHELEHRVLLLGHRSDVPRLMKAADLFVLPSYMEGLPLVVLEAMAHGLPVIASNVSSIPEIITDREDGLLFPSKDTQALLEILRYALHAPGLMRDLAIRARLKVCRFSETSMVRKTIALLQNLATREIQGESGS